MIIDFRYHVASLVAIFIALGLGILIGSTLVGEDFIENLAREQKIWIGKLESDYLNLKEETEDLKVELAEKQKEVNLYQRFASEIKPYVINNKLQGKQFAVIEMDQNTLYQDVTKVLEQSGASVVSITTFMFQEATEVLNTILLSEQITHLILNGESSQFLASMEESNLIKSIGSYGQQLDGIIFINGSELINQSLISEIEVPIINILKTKLPVYVVETTKLKKSGIEQIGKLTDVCCIDNLDTIPGQIALVLAILGPKGHYGIKSNSQSIVPVLLEKE